MKLLVLGRRGTMEVEPRDNRELKTIKKKLFRKAVWFVEGKKVYPSRIKITSKIEKICIAPALHFLRRKNVILFNDLEKCLKKNC